MELPSTVSRPAGNNGSALEIGEVQSARDRTDFIRCPYPLYADDPQWVAPLEMEVRDFINPRKHPFYRHGTATQFLARRGGRPVGRILVSDDPNYNSDAGASVGCFGMFESVDDEAVAHGLLDAAAAWIRARGRRFIRGPIDYSTNYPLGLLIDGFDTPPRILMNHHRPYYARLLESWGLAKAKDLYAWWFNDPNDMITRWKRLADRMQRHGRVVVRPFRLNELDAEVARCHTVYNSAHRDLWGFVKLTDAEFHFLAKQIAQITVPEQVLLAEVDGRPVGFSITLPDINEAIRPLHGRLTTCGLPVGLLRLLFRMKKIKTARMMVLDVVEEYRRRGVAEMLIFKTLDYGKNVIGYTGAELGWTLEDNRLINRAIEAVGAKLYKTYRIYEKSLVGAIP